MISTAAPWVVLPAPFPPPLPPARLHVLARTLATPIQHTTAGPGSLDVEPGLDYAVLTQVALAAHAPALHAYYHSPPLATLISATVGAPVCAGTSPGDLILNVLRHTPRQRAYEWHVDHVPWTLLWYPESLPPVAGGRLLLGWPTPATVQSLPIDQSQMLLLAGSVVPHAVERLTVGWTRLSVPMVFYPVIEGVPPPDVSLDAYLFGAAHE